MHRFFAPNLDLGILSREESHHALSVLRLKEGDALAVFDGKGREARATVASADKDGLRFRVQSIHQAPAPAFQLRLGQAVPKNKAMDFIIQKGTELGLPTLYPILSDRSVVQLEGERAESKAGKWSQTALEACKQCGQNWLPDIHPPLSVSAFIDSQKAWGGLKMIASLQPGARPLHLVLAEARQTPQWNNLTFLIGPEGDFTPAETGAFLSAGYLPVSLGPTVLRTETAALYTMGILLYELQRASA
ncbi:MAG: 16S rRNA (uracil(1498)-N(3))-methyltransferase [Candidatus Methylacidiphilales bacterium]|nr:16S rRNA (uracil(1498)-N(3))-methyltransferase [Candidatus Methylacidiphilales bacterium]